MRTLDYLQFFSQETLSAPRPQSHLHEFIDSWLVTWEKERETEWKILKGLGCFLKYSQIQLQAPPLQPARFNES